jgi:hypothetical protein
VANVNRALPINFCGGPEEIVAQSQEAREKIGCSVVDLSFQTRGSEDPDELMEALELFGKSLTDKQARSAQAIDSQFDWLRASRKGHSCPEADPRVGVSGRFGDDHAGRAGELPAVQLSPTSLA